MELFKPLAVIMKLRLPGPFIARVIAEVPVYDLQMQQKWKAMEASCFCLFFFLFRECMCVRASVSVSVCFCFPGHQLRSGLLGVGLERGGKG